MLSVSAVNAAPSVVVNVHQGPSWFGVVAVVVPVLALVFTVASFWWRYARRGNIVSTTAPHGYALNTTDAMFLSCEKGS
jgi:hypothetical protein